jgi:VCBS repeat protein
VNFGVGAGTASNFVAVGDFNGDTIADLAVTNFNDVVSILLGNGDGTFGAAVNFGAGTFPDTTAVGDFNGDNKPDLAVANQASNNVSILLNTCSPPPPSPTLTPTDTPTNTSTATPTDTATPAPTNTPTPILTSTPTPTATLPAAIPVVPSPTSPAGLAMITLTALAMGWLLRARKLTR